ncbi:A disintegrin and metalloproteinase with thrombospondin motifs adt-1 isoform X1 [Pocillopora verrucosa]|uniref:A disintegrin and metalloproteinase with thrombospondin motifs adt-1 isoform X1 n=2 Tax=Pocillopora verrucosa TaxID=203993 RepID=UPI00333F62D8
MGCESFKILAVVLVFCVMNEVSAEPRWAWRRRRRCQKKDCVPGTWSAWSACSHSCGPRGTQYRRRPIAKPAQCGGKCLVTTIGAKACNRFCLNGGSLVRLSCQCKAGYSGVCCEKVSGGWSSWGAWCECTKTCGRGSQYRKRSCTKPGGTGCVGPSREYKSCMIKQCNLDGGWSAWSSWGQCKGSCGTGLQTRKRSCTNPPPGYGGKKCMGASQQQRNCILSRCRDGGWSAWSSWGQCTGSCGTGLQTRKRSCTNPPPGYGGEKCMGSSQQHKNCLLKRCPVNGGWKTWSKWRACSKTCGTGSQYRTRSCTRPRPAYGGKKCTGLARQTRRCNTHHCPVKGGWSLWSKWCTCSKSCGTGSQYRTRSCSRPPPSYSGKHCTGPSKQTRNCNNRRCPVNGGWSLWSKWWACSKRCGTGIQYRTRTCTRPRPAYGGKRCTGLKKQTRNCNTHHCPVNGRWSTWGSWGACSKTCGVGKQYSKRKCNNPAPKYGGRNCYGSNVRSRSCNVKTCPANGGWSLWSKWCECSKSCGSGWQHRTRTCTRPPPTYGGKLCSGLTKQSRHCNTRRCPINGGWGPWGKWWACSKSCGTGSQFRTRTCTKPPPAYNGKHCTGVNRQTKSCNIHHCPVHGGWSNWGNWGACSKTCGAGKRYSKRRCDTPAPKYGGRKCYGTNLRTQACNVNPCPVNGRWSLWGKWSACTKTCGTGGSQTRRRTCTNPPPKYGGVCIGPGVQTKTCLVKRCPVNGVWSAWGHWRACSVTCGTGTQFRSRYCNKPRPAYGGKYCSGPSKQTKKCIKNPCPINGRWTLWSTWEDCSKTCGSGTKARRRSCSNPPPQHGGQACTGPSKQTKSCLLKDCPSYVSWGSWGAWSACSKTCGGGTQNRKRKCQGYSQGYGDCAGANEETRVCNTQSCPAVVNGGWGDWSDWSACSVSCGPGTSIRSRKCDNPPPGPGGQPCQGPSLSNKPCNEGLCPVDGGWGDWSAWSACSVTCGPSTSIRNRKCDNPAPSNGGQPCAGLPFANKPCNKGSCPSIDGGWGDWSAWSACSVTCGPGTSIRSRKCDNPAPSPGGQPCVGLPFANRPCNEGSCPNSDDCWSEWSDWSNCSKVCSCGKKYRVRYCKCGHGQGNEKCQGKTDNSQSCNCQPCPNGPPADDVTEG